MSKVTEGLLIGALIGFTVGAIIGYLWMYDWMYDVYDGGTSGLLYMFQCLMAITGGLVFSFIGLIIGGAIGSIADRQSAPEQNR